MGCARGPDRVGVGVQVHDRDRKSRGLGERSMEVTLRGTCSIYTQIGPGHKTWDHLLGRQVS